MKICSDFKNINKQQKSIKNTENYLIYVYKGSHIHYL